MKKQHQLSVFLENKPGHLLKATRLLADAKINVETMSLAETEEFGILRILVKDWQAAKKVFADSHFVVKETEVLAVQVPDHPGGLADMLEILAAAKINVEFMYGFDCACTGNAVIVLCLNKTDEGLECLTRGNCTILGDNELFH